MGMFELLRREPRFIAFGFMYTFGSSAGQTFFISVFVPSIAAAMALNDAEFSFIYAGATIASAFVLPVFGKFIDRTDLFHYGAIVGVGLTLACFFTALANGPLMLIGGIFLLRLFGQGLMSHTAITAAARWFGRDRGKALALTSLGHAMGEGLLPVTAVALIGLIGWRFSFMLSGLLLGLLVAGTALYWIRAQADFRRPYQKEGAKPASGDAPGILSIPWFWANLPLYIASPMILTALIFHQGAIAEDLGKTLELFAASFVIFAATRVPGSLVGGPLIDRYSARFLMPIHLIPAIAGILVLVFWHSTLAVLIYMALAGFSNGLGGTIRQAVIAELVRPETLGAARSLTSSMMVLSTAAGPAIYGVLLTGVGFIPQTGAVGLLWISAIYFSVSSLIGAAANRFLPAGIAEEEDAPLTTS